jgi:hypothetical protein
MTEQEHAQTPEPQSKQRHNEWLAFIVGLAASIPGIAIALTSLIQAFSVDEDTIQARIETLSHSLNNAASTIVEIEEEINRRMDLVSELEQRARLAERLQATNREEVESISLLLRSELDRKETWNFWINVTQNAFFMILGAFLGYFVERWMSRRRSTLDGAYRR